MRISTMGLCLLSFIVYFTELPSAQATAPARWAVAIKGGLFAPGLSDWERQYGAEGETILGVNLGFKLSPRLEIGVEGSSFSADGQATTTSGRPSGTNQHFKLCPVQVYLSYQFAFYEDQMFVPYIGGGYSHFTYRTSLEGGETISGAQEGYHFRGGLALLLDALDPDAADRAKEWGLLNSYLLLEAQYAKINDFGSATVDLGGWTYWGGLMYAF